MPCAKEEREKKTRRKGIKNRIASYLKNWERIVNKGGKRE
jgi:hypothetical protein